MAQAVDEAGNIWEVDAQGNPVRFLGRQGAEEIITRPADPYARPQAAADLEGERLRNAKLAQELSKAGQPQLPTGYQWKQDGSGAEVIPGVAAPGAGTKATAVQRTEALQGFNDAAALRRIAADLRKRYESGPGATKGLAGVQDFFPTAENSGFDSAAQRARGYVKRSLGFTGGEGNTVAESTALYDPYLPSTSDWDSKILDKIEALEQLAGDAEKKSITVLGGRPDANGNITPLGQERDDLPLLQASTGAPPQGPSGPDRSAPLPTNPNFDPTGQKTLGTGNYTTDADRRAHAAMTSAFKRGASAQELMQLNQDLGGIWTAGQIGGAVSYRDGTGRYSKQGPQKGAGFQMPTTGVRSETQKNLNSFLMSAPGTALTTATNGLGFGALEAIAPEAIEEQRNANPVSAFGGDVAGMIGGTTALGKIGTGVAERFAPAALTGGGKVGNAARAVAPDAAYGGIYGGVTEGDPLTGAATATLGSGTGQLFGKGLQKSFQGVSNPAAQYLTSRDIPLTIGQTLGNRGIFGRTANKLESLPVLGDMLARNRMDGLQAFEREALNDVVSPLGTKVTTGGAEGLEQAQNAVSSAYKNALSGVNVRGDDEFVSQAQAALERGRGIPTMGEQFDYATKQRLGPLFEGGQLSGPELQAALQNIRGIRRDFSKQGTMGNFAADAAGELDTAITGLVGRQAPDVMPRFNEANMAFASLAPFEKARMGGINQEAITPAQLARAVTTNTQKFGGRAAAARGDNLTDLMRYGQEALPSTVPNSGTADRGLMAYALPASLGGASYSMSDMSPETATALAALAALSTKSGQKVAQKALVKRGPTAKKIGGIFGSKKAKRISGSAGAVLLPVLSGE